MPLSSIDGAGTSGGLTILRFAIVTLLAALLLFPGRAEAQLDGSGRHIAMALVAESDAPAPGNEVTIAIAARPQPGWHGYWRNPGEAGIAPRAAWTLPEGASVGDLQYPVPQTLTISGIMNYVYEGPFALLTRLSVPKDAKPGTALPISVKLDYLVCTNEICVPEKTELSARLTVGDGAISPERRARFDRWRRALPKPLGSQAAFATDSDGALRIAIPFPADAALGDAAWFFPFKSGAIDYAAPQRIGRDGDRLLIATKAGEAPGNAFGGVLKTGDATGLIVTAKRGAVPAGPANGFDWALLLTALGGAILGGLILNIMPCVFPILSLKALGLARAGETEAHARGEALAYSAGVVLTCVALGGVLLGLRAGGAAAGWAFQLQNPAIIAFLLMLVTAIALNLAGLFEIAMPAFVGRMASGGADSGKAGAFATGALAAFIATPCTGPFMGAALGAALVLPWYGALAIFAGLGVGLALPFLAIGFIPALRRRLPKPGAWMATARHILSVPMFVTALALSWILGRQAGADGMAAGLGAALLLALGLWWSGTRQQRGKAGAMIPALILGVVALGALFVIRPVATSHTTEGASLGAQPFSEAKLAELRGQGRPVFAFFTADWCLTCKVNEKAAIETQTVAKAFADHDVAVLVGDWTDGDPELGRFIEAHNRAGVPLYLWYAPGDPRPRVLPQLLTPAILAGLPEAGVRGAD
ncbi:protein-disulfide reductase DsbD family protein [Stakelama pacifica]|uniref:Cytochrome c biogenesis transmembrane protein n=1 Tax=Stakelama pacifica TaxID=517720 RepID=A0A4R6FS98_9SPHN|nr:protein-disulfide reductase DsbD domain-containing protein [Stakelama pacifica]TDN84659.1 cytochrome c biogenesis transmembrane protein [Stakelama pacifica]